MEEIVRAFTFVINQTLAFYSGTSRCTPAEIMEAYSIARQFNLTPPTVEQAGYNFFQRENVEVYLSLLFKKMRIGTLTWSPLAGGVIIGKCANSIPASCRAELTGFS